MIPTRSTASIILVDIMLLCLFVICVMLMPGCLTLSPNIAIFGKIDRPSTQTDAPYRSSLPWIDAGGDAVQEAPTEIEGAEIDVPLTPPLPMDLEP